MVIIQAKHDTKVL